MTRLMKFSAIPATTVLLCGCVRASSSVEAGKMSSRQDAEIHEHRMSPTRQISRRERQTPFFRRRVGVKSVLDANLLATESTESGFQHQTELSSEPPVMLHWNDPTGNTATFRLVQVSPNHESGPGWLGFGIYDALELGLPTTDTDPIMVGSQAIVGILSSGLVEKYDLNGKESPAVVPMESSRQTLDGASIERRVSSDDDDKVETVMTFTKQMEEGFGDEIRIKRIDKNAFLYAVGLPDPIGAGTLGYHASRGLFTLDFDQVSRLSTSKTSSPEESTDEPTTDPVSTTNENAGSSVAREENYEALNECASDDPNYLHMVYLHDNLKLHYDLDVWSDLSPPSITIKVTYSGNAWIAFGLSPDGKMVGGEVVIGRPDLARADEEKPLKYKLSSNDINGVVPMEEPRQTLKDASIVQDADSTVLTFTKILEEDGELTIEPSATMKFIYAVGEGNILSYHSIRGTLDLNLSRCSSSASAKKLPTNGQTTTASRHVGAWAAHGTIAALAWGVATPAAITTAWFRTLVPSSWIYIHVFSNVASFFLTFVAVIIAAFAMSTETHPRHLSNSHHLLGLAMLVIVTFQVVNGFLRPPVERRDPFGMHARGAKIGPLQMPQSPREYWKVIHQFLGMGLLLLGFTQLTGGLNMFSNDFHTTPLTPLLYGYLGIFFVVLIGLKIWMVFEERRAQENVSQDQRQISTIAMDHGVDPNSDLVPVTFDMQ